MQAKKTAVKAWETGDTLILAFPSSSSDGSYLCRVEVLSGKIYVFHSCPAANSRRKCWHIREAERLYKEWRWWDRHINSMQVISLAKPIIYQKDWSEIPVPGTELMEVA